MQLTVPPLKIAFLDVGHGDSIVILLPKNSDAQKAIVIDTPDFKITKKFLDENNVESLELVVISHSHLDHSSGIVPLIEKFVEEEKEVKKLCYIPDRINHKENQKKYENLMRSLVQLDDNNQDLFTINPMIDGGQHEKVLLNNNKYLKLSVLYPSNSDLTKALTVNNCNDTSVVLLLEYNGHKILLPGDLESNGWQRLIKELEKTNVIEGCEIIKMPHHGAYYDKMVNHVSTEEIIDLISPRIAIISSTQNDKYQHPAVDTLDMLKVKKVTTYCTQVTEACHENRFVIKETLLKELAVKSMNYNSNWCPCSGDIVVSIGEKIEVYPSSELTRRVKLNFQNPRCQI